MFSISHTSELLLLYMLLAAVTVVFVMRYARVPFARVLARTVESQVSERVRELETLHENQRRMLLELSHNLQTPLSVLKGRIERFERNLLHDGQAAGIGQSVDVLSSFINELLSLAHLEQALREEERGPFPLSALMESVCEDIRVIAETDGIDVAATIQPDISFLGNEKRLREALMNLACNAVKYMGNGPVREIRFSLSTKGGRISIEVADTGMGIPENELPHVFERFYRGSARKYGSVPGTGLGLSIVERIVKEHGGVTTVTSKINKGTTFTLVLPRTKRGRLRKSRS